MSPCSSGITTREANSSGLCSGSRSSTSPRRSIATEASFSRLHRPTNPINGASTLPIKALKAMSWPMVSSRVSTRSAPTHRTAIVVAALSSCPARPTAMLNDWARYCTSSAFAYFVSHFSRTGRSMPMPLTVSAPLSASIRYDFASVVTLKTSRANFLTFGVTSTVNARIGMTNAMSSKVSLTL